MELVKGLHTTTNSQTERDEEKKKTKTCFVTQTSIEMGGQREFCAEFSMRLPVLLLYRMKTMFIINNDF